MTFASAIFLFAFLPLFLAVYYLLRGNGIRAIWITLASYVFYGWWRPDFVLLMWVSTFVDYACGQGIVKARARGERGRAYVWFTCTVNLGLLAYFKYANFGVETLDAILARFGHGPLPWTHVILPVGISFYTFKTMSYTIDVYRGTAPPVRSLREYLCFVALFPDLVAGPIVRYGSIAEQLHTRTHTLSKFYRGVLAFQAGLAKKVLIADVLAPLVEHGYATPGLAGFDAWLTVLAYAFQLYFDFSGYSDMAIGLGLMLGFQLPLNFDQPYRATSISDYWRRWHMSLSRWLRDYLYFPLGGSRRGELRTYFNLSLTMLLVGLWHGANWMCVLWGAYQAAWLVIERASGRLPLFARVPRIAQVAATFVIMLLGLVMFRAVSVSGAVEHLRAMFVLGPSNTAQLELRPLHVFVLAVASAITWGLPTTQVLLQRANLAWVLPLQLLFWLALVHLLFQREIPFLYYQF